MKDEILFVCVGQAGGNIGSLFEEMGYTCLHINSSKEDLGTLKNAKHKYHMIGGEGCSKNFDKAMELLKYNIENIHMEIESKSKDKTIVCFVFSTGGGTGAGSTPHIADSYIEEYNRKIDLAWDKYDELIALGQDVAEPKIKKKIFCAVAVIPSLKELPRANHNSYRSLTNLIDLHDMGAIFPLDNENASDIFSINRQFAEQFDKFLCIPETAGANAVRGMVDRSEVKTCLATHGFARLATCSKDKSNAANIISSLRSGIYAEMENDHVVQYVIGSLAIEEDIDLDYFEREFGTLVDNFITYNDKSTIVGLFGLSAPFDRMSLIEERVKESSTQIRRNTERAYSSEKINRDLDLETDFRPKRAVREVAATSEKPMSAMDRLKQSRGARR